MKKLTTYLTITVITFIKIAQAQSKVDSTFISQMMQLAHKRIEAFDLGDTSIWSPYVANDYIISTPTGKIINKAEVMKGFGPPFKGYKDVFNFEDVYLVKEENVVVMSYKIKEHEWWGNNENEVPDLRKTDTYINRGGNWLLLASHETFYPYIKKASAPNWKFYDSYVGQYQLMPSLSYIVSKENNKLMMQENNNTEKIELIPCSDKEFFFKPNIGFFNYGGTEEVFFVKDKSGKIKYLIFKSYGIGIKARKIK
ncbi:MAG: hypothetical protein JWR61_4205 [Ferruginibacter sp.]|uniref:nuclear transport factor 2 family protein n=1 Tax=Ferruginibacter sp. TaxID=1940288 RepID=UPI0026586E3D|nr:nuclear transport factor 2 family protein [Ferruginibacter sp.]MDB5279250.1 hypothetical protein [Ferruginibacter sp.]